MSRMDRVRIFVLWMTGIAASMLIGGGIGSAVSQAVGTYRDDITVCFTLGSALAFSCFRLWSRETKATK